MGSGNTCVKVTNDTFKVMKQHNYIIMMVTEVVTWCVSYLQLKVTNQQHTICHTLKLRLRSNKSSNTIIQRKL